MKSQFIEAMDLLQAEAEKGDLTLRRVSDILGEESHAVLLLFISLPYLIPVSIPGLSTPAGILLSLIAIRLYSRQPPWIPKRYENLQIHARTVVRVSEAAEKVWYKVSHLVKARWTGLHDRPVFRALNLVIFVLNGVLLALPLPIPLSNTLPGIAVILCALGHVEKDGVFIFLSYLWTIVVLLFFASIVMGAKYLI